MVFGLGIGPCENALCREKEAILDAFFGTFARAAQFLLLLDYDGTLAPFRVDRYRARPYPGVAKLLKCIQEQGRTRMVVVTGRPAGEVPPLLGLVPAPEVWGLHGVERLHADGRREFDVPSPQTRARLEAVSAKLRRDAFGGLLEEKPNAVVMHWRGVPKEKALLVEKQARALFEPLAQLDGLGLLEFEAGLELRAGRGKGDAVNAILGEMDGRRPAPAAYLGDDLTDEAAFRAIKGRGLGVLVRRELRETCADVWLRPPQEVRNFLKRWLQATGAAALDES